MLTEALVEGMRIVGIDFRDGILFVPEVLMSANAMKAGMFILRPLLAATGAPRMGKMVIGTVKGDIHDIGKNLVSMMMEGAGFEVIDIGINNGVEKYLDAIEKHQPEILGMSALLTTTMPYMKVVIDTLKEKGMRNDYIVLVGGAPAQRGVRRCDRRRRLLPRRRGRGRDGQGDDGAPPGFRAIARRLTALGNMSAGAEETDSERTLPHNAAAKRRVLVIACGALAREILALSERTGQRVRRHLPAGAIAQSPRTHPRSGARKNPRQPGALRRDPLPLRRLRHRRRARRACWRRKASSASTGRIAILSSPARRPSTR